MIVKKITVGFVVQTYDTNTRKYTGQEFIAGDQVDYETETGDPIERISEYLAFDMVQPQVTGGSMTEKRLASAERIQEKLETLEKWDLVNYWRSLSREDMLLASDVTKKSSTLRANILSAVIRSQQFRESDTICVGTGNTDFEIPAGTVGKVVSMIYKTKGKDSKNPSVDITLLIDGKEIELTRRLRNVEEKRPTNLDLHSIDGNW
jgi:hypothetical protein